MVHLNLEMQIYTNSLPKLNHQWKDGGLDPETASFPLASRGRKMAAVQRPSGRQHTRHTDAGGRGADTNASLSHEDRSLSRQLPLFFKV